MRIQYLVHIIAGLMLFTICGPVRANAWNVQNTSRAAVAALPAEHLGAAGDHGIAGSTVLVIDFGHVEPGWTATRGVQLSSVGTGDLTDIVVAAITGATPEVFDIQEDNCTGMVLPPGASCIIWIDFTPPDLGEYSAQFLIHSSDPITPTLTTVLLGVSLEDAVFSDRFEGADPVH